jgi:hypothetical protein
MINFKRALLGLLVAPLAPCLLIAIIALSNGGTGVEFWFVIMLPISYVVSLVLGGPTFILLTRRGMTSIVYYIFAAIVISLAPIFYVFFWGNLSRGGYSTLFSGILPVHYGIMGLMIFAGVTVSMTFWFIVRPDRQRQQELPVYDT